MRKTIILCVAAFLLIGWGVSAQAEDAAVPAVGSASCPVMGAAREVGLLVLGVGWEAIRIVLPDSCPAKQKDIDGLLEGVPSERKMSP
jgi:hypothetical protein